jgi:hypothetical protein
LLHILLPFGPANTAFLGNTCKQAPGAAEATTGLIDRFGDHPAPHQWNFLGQGRMNFLEAHI